LQKIFKFKNSPTVIVVYFILVGMAMRILDTCLVTVPRDSFLKSRSIPLQEMIPPISVFHIRFNPQNDKVNETKLIFVLRHQTLTAYINCLIMDAETKLN